MGGVYVCVGGGGMRVEGDVIQTTRNFLLVFQPLCPQTWIHLWKFVSGSTYQLMSHGKLFIITFMISNKLIAAEIMQLIVTMCWSLG